MNEEEDRLELECEMLGIADWSKHPNWRPKKEKENNEDTN